MKVLTASVLLVLVLSISSFVQAQTGGPGIAFSPVVSHCDARTDATGGGHRCDVRRQCFEAPPGHFIMEETVQVQTGRRFAGVSYGCSWEKAGSVKVGRRTEVPNKVCVKGHAHSPSGINNANSRGGVTCTMSGRYDLLENVEK